jgi:hypothetical protein
VKCAKKIAIYCECGRRSVKVNCNLTHQGDPDANQKVLDGRPVLECDEVCQKEIRKKQLAIAFGKQHQVWQDSQIMIGLARTHPLLLRRVEQQLSFLISQNADFLFESDAIVPNVVFPSMGSAQRKLVHLVAESFGLVSESFGAENTRAVWVTLRPNAKVPQILLSSIIQTQSQDAEAKGYRGADCGVLLSQLSPGIKTPHLTQMLNQWKNQWALHWINDHSCLVIFEDPGLARVACNTLRGPFVATMFKEGESYAKNALIYEEEKKLHDQEAQKPSMLNANGSSNNNNNNNASNPMLTTEDLKAAPITTSNSFSILNNSKKEEKKKLLINSVENWEERLEEVQKEEEPERKEEEQPN